MKSTDLVNFLIPTKNFNKTEFLYGTNKRQKLDLYLPKSKSIPQKTPIVFVYGGAWRDGSKEDFKFVAHALVGLGHPVIIPDYRLYPEAQFPDFVTDIADAIAYIEKNEIKLLNLRLENLILMGHSSGAHTAALLVTNKNFLEANNIKTKITGLIAIAGPYDLPLDDPEVKPVFKNTNDKEANPIANIHPTIPSTLLLHGLDDERVLPFHTKRFEKALKANGLKVNTKLYKGVNHTRIIGALALPLRFLNQSYDDIKNYLSDFD